MQADKWQIRKNRNPNDPWPWRIIAPPSAQHAVPMLPFIFDTGANAITAFNAGWTHGSHGKGSGTSKGARAVNAAEIIEAATKLIDTPEKWCQKRARLGDSFCMVGALFAVEDANDAGHKHFEVSAYLIEAIRRMTGRRMSVVNFNDEASHDDVMKVMRSAAKAAAAHAVMENAAT